MIRRLERQDIQQTMRIWLESNIETHYFVPKDYWISNYEYVKGQLLEADVYLYEQEHEIQGFAGMIQNYLAGIFVLKNCRSMGIGQRLIQYIKNKYPSFSLHVYQKNRRAVDFYLREGLKIVSQGVEEDTNEADYVMEWNS